MKAYEALVQALKIRIAKLRRQKFGQSSEKIIREIEQLELALEALEVKVAADDTGPAEPEDGADDMPSTRSIPRRRGKPRIPDDAPRERDVLDPGEICPDCGGTLRLMGEDISEILEFVAAKLKVVETVRLKKSCRTCESEGQARHWSECGPERFSRQPQRGPFRAAWLAPACWRTCWSASTRTTVCPEH